MPPRILEGPLNVHFVNQTGGNYVVIYRGTYRLVPGSGRVTVELRELNPPGLEEWANIAVAAITRGAESVLGPAGYDGTLVIERLELHIIDFRERAFEWATARALTAVLPAS